MIGERGVTLSGGQSNGRRWQEPYPHGSDIDLDDCFSAVDTETEEKILRGLAQHRARHHDHRVQPDLYRQTCDQILSS